MANRKYPFILLIILLGCLIAITLGYLLLNAKPKKIPPFYEEPNNKKSELLQEISKIDHAIYDSLYKERVNEKNILFIEVEPQNDKGYEWDFTQLLIRLPNSQSVLELKERLNSELPRGIPDVSHRIEKRSKHEIVYFIFIRGIYTHKIRLVSQDYKGKHRRLPKIAIIIDDLGYDHDIATSFIQLDLSLSLSVLPIAPYTRHIVAEANKEGRELILHLPMEPKNYPALDPGQGVLLTHMDDNEIRKTIGDHLKQVPGVRGVNNHMGSLFTQRSDKMAVIFHELKGRNLYYVDSRTTGKTVAFDLGKKMGVPVAKRSVFLDNNSSSKAITFQLKRLLGIARYRGEAIGIGHPNRKTLRVLKEYATKLQDEVEVVPVSHLVE